MSTRIAFLPKVRSKAIREFAKGQDCSLRFPLVCNFDPATDVLAHLIGINKGMSTKVSDINGAFACQCCHDLIDGRIPQPNHLGDAYILETMLRAKDETQARLIEEGLIVVPDGELI